MADDFNFSYSYQSDPATPMTKNSDSAEAVVDQTLYAVADIERVDLQNGGTLLLDKNSNSQMIVAPEVSIALHSCRTFRTLRGHADFLADTIPQLAGQQQDVIKVLESVRDHGLLTSAESVCHRLRPQSAAPAADLPATRVFIITCDRPSAVQRLLESMLHAGNLSRHEHLFLIDDSRDPQNAAQNREAVIKFNLSSPRDMHYIGAEEQQRFMAALIRDLPEVQENGIRFLIDRKRWADKASYGLSRTLSLLLSVGKRAIMMDDDVICAAVESPHKLDGLAFDGSERQVDFYTSEQDILNRTRRADVDPLTGHASCLGLTMSQAINKLGFDTLEASDLAGANSAYLNLWDAASPVLMTQSGTLGDPGTVGTDWIYILDPVSAQRALQSEGGLESALANRHYWMGQPRPRFSKLAVMSQVTGLDNSRLLPPYFPVFRGEDYLFGAMTEYLHPRSAILDYAWCVPHFPINPRKGCPPLQPSKGKGSINPSRYITNHTLHRDGISVETRLSSLAQMGRELSESSDQSLITIYREEIAESQCNLSKQLTARLRDGIHRPEQWHAYLQQSLGNVNNAMQAVANLEDFSSAPANYDVQNMLDDFRSYTHEFSLALEQWADIRNAAQRITDEMLTGNSKEFWV